METARLLLQTASESDKRCALRLALDRHQGEIVDLLQGLGVEAPDARDDDSGRWFSDDSD